MMHLPLCILAIVYGCISRRAKLPFLCWTLSLVAISSSFLNCIFNAGIFVLNSSQMIYFNLSNLLRNKEERDTRSCFCLMLVVEYPPQSIYSLLHTWEQLIIFSLFLPFLCVLICFWIAGFNVLHISFSQIIITSVLWPLQHGAALHSFFVVLHMQLFLLSY